MKMRRSNAQRVTQKRHLLKRRNARIPGENGDLRSTVSTLICPLPDRVKTRECHDKLMPETVTAEKPHLRSA